MDWWILFLKDLRDRAFYLEDDDIQLECLKFCFMPVIREKLHKFAMQWNLHKRRPSRNEESPSGQPELLYFIPENTEARDLMIPVPLDDIENAEQLCSIRIPEHGCSEEIFDLVSFIRQEEHLTMPTTPEEALVLFLTSINNIMDI